MYTSIIITHYGVICYTAYIYADLNENEIFNFDLIKVHKNLII